MSQLELFGDDIRLTDRDSLKHLDRLFFAIFPDPAAADRIDRFSRGFHRQLQLERPLQLLSRQHASVMLIGDYTRLRARHVHAAELAARDISMPAFELSFSTIGSFAGSPATLTRPAHCPLVLRTASEEMVALFNQLRLALRRKPLSPTKALVPHLTLSYGREMTPWQPIIPIRFVARELVLIHSEVGLSRYHVLGRWPFDDDIPPPCALRLAA